MNTNPETLQQVNSGKKRGPARDQTLDRWRGALMEGEREVWRSQGWIVFPCKEAQGLWLMSTAQNTSYQTC